MQTKMLNGGDKLQFVKHLKEYAGYAIGTRVKARCIETTGMSASSFRDRMNGARHFSAFEIDLLEDLYKQEIGQDAFDNQLTLFIQKVSNGDGSADLRAQGEASAKALKDQNEEMLTARLLS